MMWGLGGLQTYSSIVSIVDTTNDVAKEVGQRLLAQSDLDDLPRDWGKQQNYRENSGQLGL